VKKSLLILLSTLLLIAMSPPPKRITKEYSSVGDLVKALEKNQVYASPSLILEDLPTESFKVINWGKISILTDVLLRSDYYGDILFLDATLRYIVLSSSEHRIDPFLIFNMIQHDYFNNRAGYLNGTLKEQREAIFRRISWAYRVRAIGIKEDIIFLKYRSLDSDFFTY